MSREVLLTLLAVLLSVNFGVLFWVGIVTIRRPAAQRTRSSEEPWPDRTTTWAPRGHGALPRSGVPEEARGGSLAAVRETRPLVAAPSNPTNGASPEPDPAVASSHGVAADPASTPNRSNGAAVQPASGSSNAPSGSGLATSRGRSRRARPRRFVLPPLEEDDARSERAIEAFLGHAAPTAAPSVDRPHRRPHRRHRPAGSRATRSTLVVGLNGFGDLERTVGAAAATRVAAAFAEALWRTARVGDEVQELDGGRVRLNLDCDRVGAEIFAERAASSVQPWLKALSVPLSIVVSADTPPVEASPLRGPRPD